MVTGWCPYCFWNRTRCLLGTTTMLRIERSVAGSLVVLTVSGRVGAEHIAQLQRVLDSEARNQTALDLKDVRLVDRHVVRFLARCEADGTAIENCPIYIREWILREQSPGE